VETILRTVSSGCAGTVRPPISTAERGDELGFHRVGQQRDDPPARRALERSRERAVTGKLPIAERHLPVALDA